MNAPDQKSSRQRTLTLVDEIKMQDQDFEWYPTTQEILDTIRNDMDEEHLSVLDIGAGDGRSLQALTNGKRYAIEKSKPLIQAMDKSVFIVGTDFEQQTLIDKKVDVVFCNPPYSEWSTWANKIVKESNCVTIYLVIPERWSQDESFAYALTKREAEATVIGSFDFLNADRAARAKVDIVKIDMTYEGRYSYGQQKVDPFDLWFTETFSLEINNSSRSKYDWEKLGKAKQKEGIENALVDGRDIVGVLVELYQNELDTLMKNYKAIESLDAGILQELDVNIQGLKEAIKMKVEGLKDRYWAELFANLDQVTSRLTTSAREQMLDKLTAHTHVDFTASNARAVLIWVIKNANSYFDSQLIALVERMTEQESISLYKSNQRVFGDQDWRYRNRPEGLDRYALEYRIVLHRVGGLNTSDWEWDRREHNGLSSGAMEMISDIMTVADNLGFITADSAKPRDHQWESNKAKFFSYSNPVKGTSHELMKVRAFANRNLHIHLNQDFVRRLNVEFGRLKGWLKSAPEAAFELDMDIDLAQESFGSNIMLGASSLKALVGPEQ